ncbi:autotransporter outer membrane beta-barrel domain-containing protein [Parahaliea mediterranea]|uniref:autotransporter outer membrane beta-barrel domain-containing protein n=1 Tax=Parahaliea mediterranea TaxID=651086 RepID=UPI0013005718|nr:autotransporter outer membrane beta-barrel domain-containing protein [Parahaliea mediterranea]
MVVPLYLAPCHLAGASLLDLAGQYANSVEESAAVANQATYEALLDDNGGPCAALQRQASARCSGQTFQLFDNARELVHTANELTGQGPTAFSLGTDLAGLGTSLRWTAGEEFAAQESLTSEFVGGQLASLASRISALRGGATGFFLAGTPAAPLGLGASADSTGGERYSPWGGFFNGSYGSGDKDGTGNEDAFEFDGYAVNAGIDYRFSPHWVGGLLAGTTQRDVDFQQEGALVVDGDIETDGYSLMAFALYFHDQWYASLGGGFQRLDFAIDRAIQYPSLNPAVQRTDTRTLSDTRGDTWTLNAAAGYNLALTPALNLEPYGRLDFADTRIDAFRERDINNDAFELRVDRQDFRSLEAIAGLSLQYTATPSFAVLIPFASAEYHHQFEDDAREISAAYGAVSADLGPNARFRVATDPLDEGYAVLSVGLSAVLRGGRQRTVDGEIHGGLQGFVSYRSIQGLEDYSHNVFSAGLRYEF